MLLDHLCNLMELPYPLVIDEARKKLNDTVMILNNRPVYVHDLDNSSIHVTFVDSGEDKVITDKNFISLDVFLPDPGMYFVKNKWIHLQKRAKKQWKKSFNWDLYTIDTEGESFAQYIYKESPVEFYIFRNKLYYYTTVIGLVSGLDIILADGTFYQEILDLQKGNSVWKLYNILLGISSSTKDSSFTKDLRVITLSPQSLQW